MNGRFLIPANSKKSMLIFGLFNGLDLIIFSTGAGISLIMLMIIGPSEVLDTFLVLLPALIAVLLVAPIPNYHNVRTIIKSIWEFSTNRQIFVWKGWCIKDVFDDKQPKK